jgi:hypothetical protein
VKSRPDSGDSIVGALQNLATLVWKRLGLHTEYEKNRYGEWVPVPDDHGRVRRFLKSAAIWMIAIAWGLLVTFGIGFLVWLFIKGSNLLGLE